MRGALEPNDVDVVVEHGTDKRWLGESLYASINGRDAYVGMRQALRGPYTGHLLSVPWPGHPAGRGLRVVPALAQG
nr:hypothetical protein [Streptomyces sp. ISL-99]